ncbi:phosphoenolpyruvate synthase [Staphylospora marina]|uniref:phosphoenolpyruvate synthase n=1 Tax=Staphylospora marina TaxID=2490858 RepID=UPI000F5BE370|nr:phosphoenolpyruvate synthase [Staphylospora marina]
MTASVLFLHEVDQSDLLRVGGKGANLGELMKAGFPVPGGFCVTTRAYQEFIGTCPEMEGFFEELDSLDPADLETLRELGERIRSTLLSLEIPGHLREEIIHAWERVGKEHAYAVRSSATAEDLPSASFAGQQDTYLNIRGRDELLKHVRKCWASLFTDRAIVYRAKNGFDHRQVHLSVVVQRMVNPEVSGIMFSADPVSGNRHVVTIDAGLGLGEALVSGIVTADLYKVKDGEIIHKTVSDKKVAIYSVPEGGTVKKELSPEQQKKQVLSDSRILRLAEWGKKIEAHFGSPQDIEFCIENGDIFIVQSRPITSLYPLPDIPREPLRVLISFGHAQMMTEAMKPLGLSVLRTVFPKVVFLEAGNRLYLDPSVLLRTRIGRTVFPRVLRQVFDESLSLAVREVIERPEFKRHAPPRGFLRKARRAVAPVAKEIWLNLWKRDPNRFKRIVESRMETILGEVRTALDGVSGVRRLETVHRVLDSLALRVVPQFAPFIACYPISTLLLRTWLKEDADLHALNKSFSGNVTSEMGLEIGDLADLVRDWPEVERYLQEAKDETFWSGLSEVPGGEQFAEAFRTFLDRYGMRCPGEIDMTRPRWREAPTLLIPSILGHMQSVKPGEHRKKFAEGEKEALEAAARIRKRVGTRGFKAKRVSRLIEVFRASGALREHVKYLLVNILDECKKAIMAEAEELVKRGLLQQAEDAHFLRLDELIRMAEGKATEHIPTLVARRKEEFARHQSMKPPGVMTSEGEIVTVTRKVKDLPPNALVGTAASAGVAEGIARVILKPEESRLKEGEILVAPHTDPGWTPLFQSAKALVTEVGGLMTHGSVVAREYGIPAVVGVEGAIDNIPDGARIRVDGNRGFVEILEDQA